MIVVIHERMFYMMLFTLKANNHKEKHYTWCIWAEADIYLNFANFWYLKDTMIPFYGLNMN